MFRWLSRKDFASRGLCDFEIFVLQGGNLETDFLVRKLNVCQEIYSLGLWRELFFGKDLFFLSCGLGGMKRKSFVVVPFAVSVS